MKTKKPKQDAKKPTLELNPRETTALRRLFRGKADGPTPRAKLVNNRLEVDHPIPVLGTALLVDALGAVDEDFAYGILGQLADAAGGDEREINFMLSIVKGIRPRDQIEAMLATQMAAVHVASMNLAPQLRNISATMQQDSAGGALSKLTRTFAAQIEALDRHRGGSGQKVQQEADKGRDQPKVGKAAQPLGAANPEEFDRRSDRPRSVLPESERPRSIISGSERPRSVLSKTGRPRSVLSEADRPRSVISGTERPRDEQAETLYPRSDRPRKIGSGADFMQ